MPSVCDALPLPLEADHDGTHLRVGQQSRSVLHQLFAAFFLGLTPIARLGRTFASRGYFASLNS